MEKVKLPFDNNPILKTYHNVAHPLGILGGILPDKEKWFPWLCQKYINCCFTTTPEFKFDVYASDRFFLADQVFKAIEIAFPCNGMNDIILDFFNWNEENFIFVLKNYLCRGLYIRGNYNEKYISSKDAYGKYDYVHDYLIYGFDDEKNSFYSVGYTHNKVYEEFHIPYEEFQNSIFQDGISKLHMELLRFNENKKFATDYKCVLRDLKHYLSSTAHMGINDGKTVYGLDAWRYFIKYVKSSEELDSRFSRIFMEHRNLMAERLLYFYESEIIDGYLSQEYLEAKCIAEKVHLLFIKYNKIKDERIRESCVDLLNKALNIDEKILPHVISQIKNTIEL